MDLCAQIFREGPGRVAAMPWHDRTNVQVLPWWMNWPKFGGLESDIELVVLSILLRRRTSLRRDGAAVDFERSTYVPSAEREVSV